MDLNLETLGKVIDQFLTDNEVNMIITLPKGTLDVQIQENIRLGSVIRFYIFLNCIKPICDDLMEEMGIDKNSPKRAEMVDTLLGMIKKEMTEGENG